MMVLLSNLQFQLCLSLVLWGMGMWLSFGRFNRAGAQYLRNETLGALALCACLLTFPLIFLH